MSDEKENLSDVLLAIVSFYLRKTGKSPTECFNRTVICLPGQKGEKGDPGHIGPVGPAGVKGNKGGEGRIGKSGPMGPKGERGFRGQPGVKGDIGVQGAIGSQGIKGIKGQKGVPGRSIEKPRILSSPLRQTVLENGKATFTCESTGNPEPQIKWHFHGRQVDNERYSYPTEEGLMIERVKFKDKGKITCISRNILGEVNATTELVVLGE